MTCKITRPEGKCILHVELSDRPCLNWYDILYVIVSCIRMSGNLWLMCVCQCT